MIYVKKLALFEFRGIRRLDIDFNKKNFAICGKNGTGKSGIVDALEFALTGNISRLSGSGTGGITLKEHAPHVDSRNNPSKSKVIISVFIPSLNKDATIERNLNDIQKPIITPSTPEILAVLNDVANHPEFALSRRELIKYVISTPGIRAQEVQALLKLDKVESMRTVLQKISNADKRDIVPLKKQRDDARNALLQALDVTELNSGKILIAVNERRKLLGLPDFIEITPTTSFRDGLTVLDTEKINISKPHAIASIQELKGTSEIIAKSAASENLAAINAKIEALSADKTLLASLTRESFLRAAITLIEDDLCPVCDTELGLDELKRIVEGKLEEFENAASKRKEIENDIDPYCVDLQKLITQIKTVIAFGAALKPVIETKHTDSSIADLQRRLSKIRSFLPIADLLVAISSYGEIPSNIDEITARIETAISLIPEPSQQDAARDYLVIAQEKLEAYRTLALKYQQAIDKEAISTNVYETYGRVSTEVLNDLYKEVETNFTELYRFINNDDEAGFTAQLTPSIGKLGFNVDFYGRGYFPPGAYHSEGHQDGMGLCLYLALMKHILGSNFTFAVLDDVLMSVDTGHRREVCKLLKEQFPKTQFILTTHDEVWLRHMKTAGLIEGKSFIQFRKWDVDHGPNEWSDKDVWGEIDEYIKKSDIRGGAGLLRHYLEYVSAEISHNLRARVEFRGDAQFQLGDLLPAATSQFSKLLGDGINAAVSWGQTELVESLKAKKKAFDDLVTNSQIEQWQTNAAIHFNQWVNLEAKDFAPVATAYEALINGFSCPDCKSILYVIPERGSRETFRCSCGTINVNLKKK